MSSGNKTSLARAGRIAAAFGSLIDDVTAWEVCGSIRRKKAEVGDIEIVALPQDRQKLLGRLDRLVLDGTISKATYGHTLSPRWGETYRGMMFEGVKVEIFCASPDNAGYIRWLRTGPGDGNTHVMTRMSQTNWPVRFRDGAAWHMVEGEAHKLNAATETLIFQYLGIDEIAPEKRCVAAYDGVCRRRLDVYWLAEQRLVSETPSQRGLWG